MAFLGRNRLIGFMLIFSAILALVIGFDWIPFLRGGEIFHWLWPYEPIPLFRFVFSAVAITLYSIGAVLLSQRENEKALVGWAFLGTILLTLIATWARAGNPLSELFYRTASLGATGPYTAAGLMDWQTGEWLQWSNVMIEYREIGRHIALSPPGLPLLFHATERLIATIPQLGQALQQLFLPQQCHNYTLLNFSASEWASAILGVLMPVWAALTVFPLHASAKELIGEKSAKLTAVWPLVPALVMYGSSWNTVYPLLSMLAFCCLLRGLAEQLKFGWLILAGFLVGLLTFANFSVIPLGLLLGCYTLLRYLFNERKHYPFWRPIVVGIGFGLGVLLPWIILMLMGGDNPLLMLSTAFDGHFELERPYFPWVWMHFWEWILLGSVPFAILWLLATLRWKPAQDVLPIALSLTIAIMLLSNTARGETGRVWLFFTPFLLIAAAQYRFESERRVWAALYTAQGLMLLALISTWAVMAAGDIKPPPETPLPSDNLIAINANFNSEFQLVAWSGEQQGDTILLSLAWQSSRFISTPYYFAALPVAPDGSVGESFVWQPDETRYPSTCWQQGQIVGDQIQIPLPNQAIEGAWYISLIAFADVNHPENTLALLLPDGTTDRQIGLGPVIVSP